MKRMKRLISLSLALALVFSTFSVAVFAKKKCGCGNCPLVIVSGFATVPLELDGKKVWSPEAKGIIKAVGDSILPLAKYGITKRADEMMDKVHPEVLNIFKPVLCDDNGDPIFKTEVKKYPESIDNYPEFYNGDDVDEQALSKTAIEKIGGDHVFFFSYDWRLDTMEHAKELKKFVNDVKKKTGHDKVTLAGCSMGGTVILSYLKLYGSSDLHNFILDNAAFQGTSLVGELLSLHVEVDSKSFADYIYQFSKSDFLDKILRNFGVLESLVPVAQRIVADTSKRLGAEVLFPVFANMPGMWSLVADEEYETAKKIALDEKRNAKLIKKIDEYHYGVQKNAKKLLKNAVKNGVGVYVLANYNYYGVPITPDRYDNNDILIDTKYASGGATCALLGETLPKGYKQKVKDGHDHISPDRTIDASTCMLPDHTWFIKNMKHLDYPYGSEAAEFMMWLVMSKKYYSVFTSEKYPQFMEFDYRSGKLSPLKK
ncbi:MAG: alpha/beta fold hydrolase [Clostridiales bacterium]|nr:alpha/beta fold hydrolase [Clostridiales bacterium]